MKAIGHYGHRVFAGILLVLAALNIAGVDVAWGSWVGLAAMVVAVAGQRFHDGRICERCVATMPLNGAERAERRRRILRAVHTMRETVYLAGRPIAPPVALYALGAAAAVAVICETAGLERGGRPSLTLFAVLYYVPMAGLMLALSMHARLQPWCPYCRWGRGDDGPHEEAPDPDPSGRLPHPV